MYDYNSFYMRHLNILIKFQILNAIIVFRDAYAFYKKEVFCGIVQESNAIS